MQSLSLILILIIVQTILANEDACDCKMDSCDCSDKSIAITGPEILKILGGVSARPNSWKWVVSLRKSDIYFCIGSILNEWYIITAAHCFKDYAYALPNITICAGKNLLSDTCRQQRSVEYVASHPKFNLRTGENDIALVRVDIPFDFMDTSIDFIHLPDTSHNNEYPSVSTDVIAVGWGKTETSATSDTLQEITLQIVDKSTDTCDDVVYNHTLQLCAAALGKYTCKGDSGGPLMVFGASEHWELIGITSYGKECAKAYAGIYTRVTAFLAFIQMIINNTLGEVTNNVCSCQCPRGFYEEVAYTTANTPKSCVVSCILVRLKYCVLNNTYACLGTNCIYSEFYQHPVAPLKTPQRCSCECPRGSFEGFAGITENTPEACVDACIGASSTRCLRRDTYTCLGTKCTYGEFYEYSITGSIAKYKCSCQCPRGSYQGVVNTTRSTPEACVDACRAVSSYWCVSWNTYACLGTNCTYSDSYDYPTITSMSRELFKGNEATMFCTLSILQLLLFMFINI